MSVCGDTQSDRNTATGNITATVMGRNYLGAGGSIANTMVFGYVVARHAAGRYELSPSTKSLGFKPDSISCRRRSCTSEAAPTMLVRMWLT